MSEGPGSSGVEQRDPGDRFAAGSSAQAAYRGFLFADLRGFTAFVESHGEKAAADLLDVYRALVREQVAKLAGAEVRTEGDSFYVVFPSARSAVACGMEITSAAARHLELHAEQPIRVGIGINAGEATQRGEGFVGTAVNLAARVCSQARAGEVLITGTVREAVRGSADLRFTARGSPRLKGIAESVPLFAVEAAGGVAVRPTPRWPGTRPWSRALAIAGTIAAAVVVAGGAAVVGGLLREAGDGSSAAASSSPSPSGVAIERAGNLPTSSVASTDAPPADEFPNPEELDLLASVDIDVDLCDRADSDDRPRISVDPVNAEYFGIEPTRPPLAVSAGISCVILSAAAPSSVMYWSAAQMLDYRAADVPDALILSEAGTFDVPNGDCGTTAPAVGRWSFGGSEGWLLCRELYGDALLEWTYDGSRIIGVATRRDGDHVTLYGWWRANARFLTD